jgi:hypothetical protein
MQIKHSCLLQLRPLLLFVHYPSEHACSVKRLDKRTCCCRITAGILNTLGTDFLPLAISSLYTTTTHQGIHYYCFLCCYVLRILFYLSNLQQCPQLSSITTPALRRADNFQVCFRTLYYLFCSVRPALFPEWSFLNFMRKSQLSRFRHACSVGSVILQIARPRALCSCLRKFA